jgi:thioredoxin-like negative regulator of GroEL
MIELKSLQEVEDLIRDELGVLLYFSTPTCNVCQALKPKIIEEFKKNFPLIKLAFIDSTILPEVSANYQVFSVPTMILFLDRKEFAREGRNVSVSVFVQKVKRVYEIMTS